MQLVAYLNGERVDATEMAHEPWRALGKHPHYKDLVLLECGLRANRVTRRGRQFFKHHSDVACGIEHKSESPQHLAMKTALKDRINAVPGWSAEVEQEHPERAWIADVMATHTNGRRLAFEVQLSLQSEDEYIRRSQRYLDDGVAPVWVVPEHHDEFRVKLPMIATGFGKTSDLPQAPAALMDLARFQSAFGVSALVGTVVEHVLDPSFRWPPGTPRHQLEEIERMDKERAERKAAAEREAAELAEAKRLAEESSARIATSEASRFTEAAFAPDVRAARPVLASTRIWASAVRCLTSGHPMLIWRLTQPTPARAAADPMWRPKSENFENVRAHVDVWLAASGNGLVKAKVYQVKGWPIRRTFVCPECQEIIQGRWVSALPPAKWSVIAEGNVARAQAREVLYRQPPAPPPPAPVIPAAAVKPPERIQTVHRPALIQEGDPGFIGPRQWAHWMSEVRDSDELAARLAAKDARAARKRAISENPRYIGSANGFRFQCTDCGEVFEDDNEGIHADARCRTPGARSSGWR